MAPKQKTVAPSGAATSGMKALFEKKMPKAAPAKTAATTAAQVDVSMATPDSKAPPEKMTPQDAKKRKLDERGAAVTGGGGDADATKKGKVAAAATTPAAPAAAATPAPAAAAAAAAAAATPSDTGPISMWTSPPGKDKSLLSSSGFDPALRASDLTMGKPIGFDLLSGALSEIEALKGSGHGSRKKATVVLSNLFRCLLYFHPEDLVPAIYFVSNKVAPDYEQSELGIGDSTIISAMCETFGRSPAQVKNQLAIGEASDLGEVALMSRAAQKMIIQPPKLTIEKVFAEMKAIANAHGKDCTRLKKDKIKKMLVSSRNEESKYIVRMLQAKMRIGICTPTVLEAIACAFVMTKGRGDVDGSEPVGDVRKGKGPNTPSLGELDVQLQSMLEAVRQAFTEVPNFDLVMGALLRGADANTLPKECHISLGIPVKPMLAKPSKGIPEVIERLSGKRFTGEWKYDGERAQIHIINRDTIQVYSRNSENMTEKYPDVINVVKEALTESVESGIIDSEVVAWDITNSRILPFQILSTRGKKNVNIADIKVQVCIMPFDCMLYNGTGCCLENLEARRAKLKTMLKEVPGKVQYAVGRDFTDVDEEEIQTFLDESIAGSCEGLMLKTLVDNACYMPSKRSLNWLKLKKDYIDGMGDSLDVVPLGAFYGKGKRTGSYGAFLLAVYNAEEEEFQTVCKAGTGFSDEDLVTHYEFYKNKTILKPESNYNVHEKMKPDVWLEACQVWEIKAADLQISPVHTSAMGVKADGKGIGLRFPRFLRIREDKQPEEATGADQIVDMFEAQASIQKDGGGDVDDF